MSVATTCSPLARKSEVQLAPITPVPMMAMRRMGLVLVMSVLRSDFGVSDAGEIALGVEEVALVLAVEISGIDRAGEVGAEQPGAGYVESDADCFHQVGDQDLRRLLFVHPPPIDRVAARWIATSGPIEGAAGEIELEVNRLGQLIEQHLD